MSYKFDSFILDTEKFLLSADGVELKVEPLVFDLISYLISNANSVVSRDDLLASVWQGRIVSDTTISSAIKSARKVLGDSGSRQKYIKTIHGRGFSFVLEQPDEGSSQGPNQDSDQMPSSVDYISPSLLIMVQSSSLEHVTLEHCNHLARELERIFSRIPLLEINSEAQRIRKQRDSLSPRQIYEQVGSEYILEGQFSGTEKNKFNVQLIDAKAGSLVWSHNFEYAGLTPEVLIDTCLLDTVSLFEPQIQKTVYQSIKANPMSGSAETKFIEASGLLALKGWHESSFLEAAQLLRESIAFAPEFSQAPAYLALILAFGHRIGALKNREAAKLEALTLIDQALDIDSYDSGVLGFCGCALADVGHTDRGLDLLNKALSINPANSQALVARGAARMMKYELAEAIKDMEDGIALSALDSRLAVWRSILASAYLVAKNVDKAREQALLGCRDDHRTYLPRVALAGVELMSDNPAQVRAALSEAKAINHELGENEIIALLGKSLGGKVCQLVDLN
jgi:DNA-binding winged helix-turn-helix (wHTH) protein/tetratricopeptide (TPR) repeat protein